MSLENDLQDRFGKANLDVSGLDVGARSAAQSSDRRTTVARVGMASMALMALLVSYAAFNNLTSQSSSELQTTNPDSVEDTTRISEDEDPQDSPAVDDQEVNEDTPPTANSETDTPPTSDGETTVRQALGPVSTDATFASYRLVGVESNDTLNARSGPGTEFDVLFEFAHTATGVLWTGENALAGDGARWFEVFAPTSGQQFESGWVNAAFLEVEQISDARPCVFNGPQDHYIGIDWKNTEGSAESAATIVSNIETYRFGGCIRTVIEFADTFSFFEGGGNPVTALPNDIVVSRDSPPSIDFGRSIVGAEQAIERFSERPGAAQATFLSLGSDGQLDGAIYFGPTTTMWVSFDNTNGRMTIDVADIGLPLDADPALVERVGPALGPIADGGEVIITNLTGPGVGSSWTFTGLARPFENQMGVAVRTVNGEPIPVGWIGAINEGLVSDSNGVSPTTWTEALGQFSVTITLPDDVDPDDVVVMFEVGFDPDAEQEYLEIPLADFS